MTARRALLMVGTVRLAPTWINCIQWRQLTQIPWMTCCMDSSISMPNWTTATTCCAREQATSLRLQRSLATWKKMRDWVGSRYEGCYLKMTVIWKWQLLFENGSCCLKMSCYLKMTVVIWKWQLLFENDSYYLEMTVVIWKWQLLFENDICYLKMPVVIWKCQLLFENYSCYLKMSVVIWNWQLLFENDSWYLKVSCYSKMPVVIWKWQLLFEDVSCCLKMICYLKIPCCFFVIYRSERYLFYQYTCWVTLWGIQLWKVLIYD